MIFVTFPHRINIIANLLLTLRTDQKHMKIKDLEQDFFQMSACLTALLPRPVKVEVPFTLLAACWCFHAR